MKILLIILASFFIITGCSGTHALNHKNDSVKTKISVNDDLTSMTHIRGIFSPLDGSKNSDVWGEVTPLTNGQKQLDVYIISK